MPTDVQLLTTDTSGRTTPVGSGNPLPTTGGAGGTDYLNDGVAVVDPTGTALIWFDGSDIPKAVTSSQPLPIVLTNSSGVEVGTTAVGLVTRGPAASGALVVGNPVLIGGSDGTNARTLKTQTSGDLNVFMTSALNTTDDGVFAVGNVAHDAADAGAPLKIGGKARTTNPTAVADADRVDALFDKLGRLVVVLGQVRDLRVQQSTTITTSTGETTILTAGAAGVFHDVTNLFCTNSSATDTVVTIRDDTAGTAVMFIAVKAGTTAGFAAPQAVGQTTAAKNWTAQSSASITSLSVFVQANKVV